MRKLYPGFLWLIAMLFSVICTQAQVNDNCANATPINIASAGFGIGTYNSSQDIFTSSTSVEPGETFVPGIISAGQTVKSIWYKFTLPTTRSLRVTLSQPGSLITAGDVGFAVYKTANCFPTSTQLSALTPIFTFGNSLNACMGAGTYLVQVSAKASANGPVSISLETNFPSALYDRPTTAYDFGLLQFGLKAVEYFVDCQSTEDASETCNGISNSIEYIKSSWHVFNTPAYFDYISLLAKNQGSTIEKFGFKVYQGDVRVSPYSTLPVVRGCDSLVTGISEEAKSHFKCGELLPNSTYSVQIFYKQSISENVRVGLAMAGPFPTRAPLPVAPLHPLNTLGAIPANPFGHLLNTSDYLACNSRYTLNPCGSSLPASPIQVGPSIFNLSTFYTFSISTATEFRLQINGQHWNHLFLARIYKQNINSTCSGLDTSNIISVYQSSAGEAIINCLQPGDYTLQVMGRSADNPSSMYYGYGSLNNSVTPVFLLSELGNKADIRMIFKSLPTINRFSLNTAGAVDSVNALSPLQPGIFYNRPVDTLGCSNTLLPADTTCGVYNLKAIYRELKVADSGFLRMSYPGQDPYGNGSSILYRGSASALASAQNVFSYPQRLNGLQPITYCMSSGACYHNRTCVVPGDYTSVTFGYIVGSHQDARFGLDTTKTIHHSPSTAEDMGDILAQVPATGGTVGSNTDYFSCKDNIVSINGYTPCAYSGGTQYTATKAIYRQFYLSAPSDLAISGYHMGACGFTFGQMMTLFKGRISDGVAGLTVMNAPWQCFSQASVTNCQLLPAGWYTLISYGLGPTYQNPLQDFNYSAGGFLGMSDKVTITVRATCTAPKFNRPFKASVDMATNQPYLFEYSPQAGHTAAYPNTAKWFTLARENFNCIADTPFIQHMVPACAGATRVAYYVFRTTQVSYLMINTRNLTGKVYRGDVRTDSALFASATPIQDCVGSYGSIQLCNLQPGVFTLAIYADVNAVCTFVEPIVYIDQFGFSRFDHANKAYDFDLVPPTNTWVYGKAGDVNPLDPSRAPSNDFFYCTTGARSTDPTEASCQDVLTPNIYNAGQDIALYAAPAPGNYPFARRNLWYSFVTDKGGLISVRVDNKTIDKGYVYPFAIYKSDVNGNLSFVNVVSSGQVDSSYAQGLSFVVENGYWGMGYQECYTRNNQASFYRDPCTLTGVRERYYVVVFNSSFLVPDYPSMQPNSQVEVAVKVDPLAPSIPQFDHYYQASTIGTNLGTGTFNGQTASYSCATRDFNDPIAFGQSYCADKTLWYKFSTTVSGSIQWRMIVNGTIRNHSDYHLQLFRQTIPGDSTSAGLQAIPGTHLYDGTVDWNSSCLTPGTYYIILTGCSMVNETVYPIIKIQEYSGDFCSAPVVATLNGVGTSVTPAIINCHTIGTDFGEFNSTLICPPGVATQTYKTTWFRIDITGTDTLDVTTFLTQSTNVGSSLIKYRFMRGNCSAMQANSCVMDAQTVDTYDCLAPGSYYIQVFSPKNAIGTVSLNLSSVIHADTCLPEPQCLASAAFIPQFDCNVNDSASFINLSTYGTGVSYQWDFGYAGQTSTAVAPKFRYPALTTSQTYNVRLIVMNNGCGGRDTVYSNITIPARPNVNLGPDTLLCNGGQLTLNATTHPGSTYYWVYNGSTNPIFTVPVSGSYSINVTYGGCTIRDTISVYMSPITPVSQTKIMCSGETILLNSVRGVGETYQWNTGATTGSINVTTPGLYVNTIRLNACTTRDTFRVLSPQYPFAAPDTTMCFPFTNFQLNATMPGATGYLWSTNATTSSINVSTAGTYWVNINYGTCSIRDTIIATASAAPVTQNNTVQICAGASYTLPWGLVVNSAGVYRDTLQTFTNCDSVFRNVTVVVQNFSTTNQTINLCAGQTYTLPWGQVINAAGVYTDTLHYTMGCDSIRRSVTVLLASVATQTSTANICAGQNYTLPWGQIVNAAGVYSDTLHYVSGCDSIRRTVTLTMQNFATVNTNASICIGQSYTLPWGQIVNSSGIYRDTLHYASGCDSVRRTVNLAVQNFVSQNTTANICAGQNYTLPWGQVINTPGIYSDTLHYLSGCDSIRRTVTVSLQNAVNQTMSANICAGQSYTLPWGQVVNSAGIYSDTLHYVGGCDSIRRTVTLTLQNVAINNITASICAGQSYTLPSGATVSSSGVYSDTLRYISGCDSIRRTVNLVVQNFVNQNTTANICSGQSYTLPWGQIVNTAGTYTDTLHYVSGCDSIRRAVSLTVQNVATQNTTANICAGQSYTLPWGQVVSTGGVYADTLHYVSGCDSFRRTVTLVVQNFAVVNTMATICAGQSYTLPWGLVVASPGAYHDTLHYVSGCDSVRRTVNLNVQNFATQISTVNLCAGQTYTLPWGVLVNSAGMYTDTLHYVGGCDSVRRAVTITVQNAAVQDNSAIICAGQSFTLPWGQVVNSSGIYRDTLHYATGCDSIRRAVTLTVQQSATQTTTANICAGQSYLLPWGQSVSLAGVYRDTLHYSTSCDSIYRVVTITVDQPQFIQQVVELCQGNSYTTPGGQVVQITGVYQDTVRLANGCIDKVFTTNLTMLDNPVLQLSKSNDINCAISIATLSASGANEYVWSPSTGLNSITGPTVIASPSVNTLYTVIGTAENGCSVTKTIMVNVQKTDQQNAYLLPSAFTPNNDGLNDCFGAKHWGNVTGFELTVYNRYGQPVFQTKNPAECWDGRFKGVEQNSAAFVYIVKANGDCGVINKTGTIVLIR